MSWATSSSGVIVLSCSIVDCEIFFNVVPPKIPSNFFRRSCLPRRLEKPPTVALHRAACPAFSGLIADGNVIIENPFDSVFNGGAKVQ